MRLSHGQPQLRVTDPADLLETIPYLLGFHPVESLVLLGFHPTAPAGRVHLALRTDLPPPGIRLQFDELIAPLVRSGVDSVLAVWFTGEGTIGPAQTPVAGGFSEVATARGESEGRILQLSGALAHELARSKVHMYEELLATASRFWSLRCQDKDCCPSRGRPRRRDSAVAAQAVYAGLVALPDRAAVQGVIAGASQQARSRVLPYLATYLAGYRHARGDLLENLRREDVELFWMTARGLLNPVRRGRTALPATPTAGPDARLTSGDSAGDGLHPALLARLGVALSDLEVRDELWLGIDEAACGPDQSPGAGNGAGDLLGVLHALLPTPFDAAPLFLFGWSRWRAGDGTMACLAAERALESDPGYSAARLLRDAVQSGLDPRSTPALRASIDDPANPVSTANPASTAKPRSTANPANPANGRSTASPGATSRPGNHASQRTCGNAAPRSGAAMRPQGGSGQRDGSERPAPGPHWHG